LSRIFDVVSLHVSIWIACTHPARVLPGESWPRNALFCRLTLGGIVVQRASPKNTPAALTKGAQAASSQGTHPTENMKGCWSRGLWPSAWPGSEGGHAVFRLEGDGDVREAARPHSPIALVSTPLPGRGNTKILAGLLAAYGCQVASLNPGKDSKFSGLLGDAGRPAKPRAIEVAGVANGRFKLHAARLNTLGAKWAFRSEGPSRVTRPSRNNGSGPGGAAISDRMQKLWAPGIPVLIFAPMSLVL